MATQHPLIRSIKAGGAATVLLLAAGNATAAGFALIEQSVSSMGTAYAGAGSAAEDASYVFFNPASMSELEGTQMSTGVHIVLPNTEFKGSCTYNPANALVLAAPPPAPGDPCGAGNDGGDGGVTGVVPHFTVVTPINTQWDFGFGVNAPFGLSTDYKDGWEGRYSAVESAITAINLNPTLSVKLNDQTSIGFGVNAMYAHLELENAIDDGVFAGAPGAADSTGELDIEDWGYGFNFGILVEPSDSTRLGLAYRSKVDVELDGDFKTNSAVASSQDAKADVSLPDTLLLSATHQVTPKTTIMADVLWTHWSRIPDLKVKFKDGSSNTFHLDWENTVRVAVGASYKHTDKVTLRTGVAYDETPTPNKEKRLAALPDNDRIWLDFGIGYKYSNELSFDLGYAHLFIDDPKINSESADSSGVPGNTGIHLLTGKYDASTDIISAQMNYKF